MFKRLIKKRLNIVLFAAVLILTEILSMNPVKATQQEGINEDFTISSAVVASWEDYEQLSVCIRNNSDNAIDNWSVSFSLNGNVEEIWDAYVCSNVDNYWLVRHNGYNSHIAPNSEISFSMVVLKNEDYFTPEDFHLSVRRCNVNPDKYSLSVVYDSRWDSGCSGRIVINNKSDRPIYGWQLSANGIDDSIIVWNCDKNYKKDLGWVVCNSYNEEIPANESISIGFLSDKSSEIDISAACLTEMRSCEILDVLIDKDFFGNLIRVTDKYQIVPIFSLNHTVAAYMVVFLKDSEVCSYVVINNCANDQEDYILEFGNGHPWFYNAVDWFAADRAELIYIGGYDYFVKKQQEYYIFNGEQLEKIIIPDTFNQETCGGENVQYFQEYVTLTYQNVEKLETGYLRKVVDKRREQGAYDGKSVLTMSKIEEYYGKINNHCGPSAILNTLLIFKSMGFSKITIDINDNASVKKAFSNVLKDCGVFFNEMWGLPCWTCKSSTVSMLKKYGYTDAYGKTYAQASWDQIKTCIDNTFKDRIISGSAVHSTPSVAIMYLDGSQIYGVHFVIGTGYVEFAHSTGWQSKWVQIFDQWTNDLRYVHYNLGINYISVLEIFAEAGVNAPPVPTPTL